jgi:hypothetical protein
VHFLPPPGPRASAEIATTDRIRPCFTPGTRWLWQGGCQIHEPAVRCAQV